MKRFIVAAIAALLSISAFSQTLSEGGIKATVVSRVGRTPIAGANVELKKGGVKMQELRTGNDGKFFFQDLANDNYSLIVAAPGYTETQVNVTVEKGLVRDLIFVTLVPASQINEVDDSSFGEFDLDDSGYTDTPTILFASNDVFTNVAGYGFSAVRYKNRGYNSESQEVYLAGVPMNDAITGYSPYSLWSGLNEAMRSKESTIGLESADYSAGGYNGVTNISAMPSDVRPGLRMSVLSNSAMYRFRFMVNYASGVLDNGWSYAINASARIGGNDWIEGVFYRNFALYAGAEKRIGDEHRIALIAFATPGERGAQNASTQEVYDLMKDNMYNSNWGYQNGKVRNARVRKTFEPVIALRYLYTPSDSFEASATLLYRTGFNGYTALDWYDAPDPRPDYYRNLPSYFFMDDSEYNRSNVIKYGEALEMWRPGVASNANYQHINWDRLYNVNYNSPDGRSKYAQEQRHVDQNDINLSGSIKWNLTELFTVTAGINGKINRTRNYKKIADLLGGQYYLNVDQFAERDFASNAALIQNDLDYFLEHGEAEKIGLGDSYGYDYLAQIRRANLWGNGTFNKGKLSVTLSAALGYEGFWREGLVRKGLFAGLDDDGKEIFYNGVLLTSYDSKGNVISSKGKSEVSNFLTGSAKLLASYTLSGGHRFSASFGYFSDAPTFNQAFVSARTRNSLVDGLCNSKTVSGDLSYQLSTGGYNLRATAYYTKIMDQTDVMSFYDDSQQSFTNFAMTGIDQRHVGIEFGAKMPLFVSGLTASAVLSLGEFVYTSNPHMIQTVDNSAEIIRDETLPYWQSNPVFKKNSDGSYAYAEDGSPIVEKTRKHYVPSTPQLAGELALNYRTNSYWFFELNGQYFAKSWLDMNPLYRTQFAVSGPDGVATPEEIEYMTTQECFNPCFLLNASAGKSWYIQRKYNIGFSFEVKNILNNRDVRTGGYEQTRLISTSSKESYKKFDSKYFYMPGINYMLNIYFRF
ncbi:MAG: TonB-dependent receptor [Bacteroidales bacterium]|nr:carboxypeptidase regulatory-like domain-containing protein [Bacteroidales bacterium]MCI5483426.1 TonB-dependent receptor [Bacteroidales bacterium]